MAKDKQQKRDLAGAKAASGKMRRKEFEKELTKLQVELTRMQAWVQATGARIIVVFEGRDTAGKGGVISRITARTSPRVYRHVALPAPSDREKTQVYAQRYIAHFPAAGEIVLFDRSWYNRAGVDFRETVPWLPRTRGRTSKSSICRRSGATSVSSHCFSIQR
jgi:polyphosphate kinase